MSPAKHSEHMITAAPLRAAKNPSVSRESAPSEKAKRSRRSRRPSMDPQRLGEWLKATYSCLLVAGLFLFGRLCREVTPGLRVRVVLLLGAESRLTRFLADVPGVWVDRWRWLVLGRAALLLGTESGFARFLSDVPGVRVDRRRRLSSFVDEGASEGLAGRGLVAPAAAARLVDRLLGLRAGGRSAERRMSVAGVGPLLLLLRRLVLPSPARPSLSAPRSSPAHCACALAGG